MASLAAAPLAGIYLRDPAILMSASSRSGLRSYFNWLDQRRDIKAIFFIHDLLPLSIPEHFRSGEFERHRRRIANLARFGSAAIVTSEFVRTELTAALRDLGRSDFPIFTAAYSRGHDVSHAASAGTAAGESPLFRLLQYDRTAQEPPSSYRYLAGAGEYGPRHGAKACIGRRARAGNTRRLLALLNKVRRCTNILSRAPALRRQR